MEMPSPKPVTDSFNEKEDVPVVELNRVAFFNECTLGRMHVAGKDLHVLELPWKDNKPNISCIPSGRYTALMDNTTTSVLALMGGQTWYLTGKTVGRRQGEKERYAIAIHIGNTVSDIKGCLAPGLDWGKMDDKMAVLQSRGAMRHMFKNLPRHFILDIANVPPGHR